MITKLFRATVVLLALAPLPSMPVSAGQIKPGAKIYLKCTVSGPVEFKTVTVENTTNSTIPNGTTIHWSLCSAYLAKTGSITLQVPLAKGLRISWGVEAPGCGGPYTPKAWYWK